MRRILDLVDLLKVSGETFGSWDHTFENCFFPNKFLCLLLTLPPHLVSSPLMSIFFCCPTFPPPLPFLYLLFPTLHCFPVKAYLQVLLMILVFVTILSLKSVGKYIVSSTWFIPQHSKFSCVSLSNHIIKLLWIRDSKNWQDKMRASPYNV